MGRWLIMPEVTCGGGRTFVVAVLAALTLVFCAPLHVCCPLGSTTCRAAQAADTGMVDRFMGDYSGNWQLADGYDSGSLAAQVIALGDGQYRANLLEDFDMSVPPYAVLDGRLQGDKVVFAGSAKPEGTGIELDELTATIEGRSISGKFRGRNADGQRLTGTISLEKTVRLSPTLGAKPPAGAVVLFDGKSFGQWKQIGRFAGLVNIADVLEPADNAVAYLRSHIWSDADTRAVLEIGSDDGVRVWLNGQVVHANNASRGVSPGQDKVTIALQRGWNDLILKVNNGGGGWGACARIAKPDGKPLDGIAEKTLEGATGTRIDKYLKKNNSFLTLWQACGPYKEAGKGGPDLFDVPLGPEKRGWDSVRWKDVDNNGPDENEVRWRLVDGAMEIKAGTGSIVTKRKFKDFRLHIEFRTPFMPKARGQGRGNSGVYLQDRYEVQVLDSYGLEGLDNECGGIYQVGAPYVNMCGPPMQWQTYDITFRAPRFDSDGRKTEDATATVIHNGVMIHDKLRLPGPTGGALDNNIAEPGGIYLQDHGNPVQFRNIWLVETR